MTIAATGRATAALVLLLGLAACAERPASGAPPAGPTTPSAVVPGGNAALVLRVEHVGGFIAPEVQAAGLPMVSVYADGRVIVTGPVAAIYPAFAWPNQHVFDVGEGGVQELADGALAAGVAETGDLGRPPIADMPSTRFTLVTAAATHVREIYGLTDTLALPDSGLTAEQSAARQELFDLVTRLTDIGVLEADDEPPGTYTPAAVAAIVRPWQAPEADIAQGLTFEPMPWPGPSLPGDQLGRLPDVTCAVATGKQATAVIAAAAGATVLTPWTSGGARWSVSFRPLLPDESGCADLVD